MNDIKIKTYCVVCECTVVAERHVERCRPKSIKGWDDARRRAWLGDSVHRVDVQIALQLMGVEPSQWEIKAQAYTSGAAQAHYMRRNFGLFEGRSDHSVSTVFESRYSADFREKYLQETFGDVWERIVAAWQIPDLFYGVGV